MQMDLDPHLHRGGAPGRDQRSNANPKNPTRAPA